MKWFDYGESSLTLLAVYCDMDKLEPYVPYDPIDFRKCVHLIKCLNLSLKQEKELLEKTAKKYPIWKPYLQHWGKLMKLYNEEKRLDKAPKLYKKMLQIRKGQRYGVRK